jgi:hypothetical protein
MMARRTEPLLARPLSDGDGPFRSRQLAQHLRRRIFAARHPAPSEMTTNRRSSWRNAVVRSTWREVRHAFDQLEGIRQ